MKLIPIRAWKFDSQIAAVLSALEEHAEEEHAKSGNRVILVRRVTDAMIHERPLLKALHERDIPIVTVIEDCEDDSPELAKSLKQFDDAVIAHNQAVEQNRLRAMSGRKQMILKDTVVKINGVPFMLRAGMYIEGNTSFEWAAQLKTPLEEDFEVAHDAEAILERRAYEAAHPVPEPTMEEKKAFLKAMYDSDGFEGHN